MSELLNSSVSIEYRADESKSDVRPPSLVLAQDDVKAAYGYVFARMYFSGKTPTTLATSGYPVSTVNTSVVSDETEFLMFTGRDEAGFSVPVVSDVRLEQVGRLIGLSGETISQVSLVVDAERGTVRANRPLFGTFLAKYRSTFRRLQTRFASIPGAADDSTQESEFAPLVLMAYQTAGDEPVSLTLTPPPKSEDPDKKANTGAQTVLDGSTGERIVLEIDQTFPVSLTHAPFAGMGGLVAVARVAVYSPRGGCSYTLSNGIVQPDRYRLDSSVELSESVTFNGTQSVSVKYPPSNGITAVPVGAMSSRTTGGGIFQLITAPSNVTLADWRAFGVYTITGSREVGSNEIVATTAGIAVPVNGQGLATYTTRRTYVNVFWSRTDDWFPPTVLTASDARGNVESIAIPAPERRGR